MLMYFHCLDTDKLWFMLINPRALILFRESTWTVLIYCLKNGTNLFYFYHCSVEMMSSHQVLSTWYVLWPLAIDILYQTLSPDQSPESRSCTVPPGSRVWNPSQCPCWDLAQLLSTRLEPPDDIPLLNSKWRLKLGQAFCRERVQVLRFWEEIWLPLPLAHPFLSQY